MESVLLQTIIEDILEAEKNIEKKVNNGIHLIKSDKIKTYSVTNTNIIMDIKDSLSIKFKKYHTIQIQQQEIFFQDFLPENF